MSKQPRRRLKNLTLAGISALTGFIGLFVVLGALFVGLWVDSQLGQRGPAIVCFVTASAPIGLFLMVRTALAVINQIDLSDPGFTEETPVREEED